MSVPRYLLGRRAALAAVAFVVVLLGALAWAAYLMLLAPDDTDVSDARDRLARLQAQAAALPQVQAQMAALTAQLGSQPNLLQGDSDSIAQAALQSDVKAIVEANSGEVRSANALSPTPERGMSLLSVQFDIVLPVSKMSALAYAIESHAPYYFLSAVDVAGPQSWPADAKAPVPQMEIRWTVSGYRRSAAR